MASLSNPNLIDFQQWQTIFTGNYITINALNDKIYTVNTARALQEIDGTQIATLFTFDVLPLDSELVNSFLIYSTVNQIFVFDENITLTTSFLPTEVFATTFNSRTLCL